MFLPRGEFKPRGERYLNHIFQLGGQAPPTSVKACRIRSTKARTSLKLIVPYLRELQDLESRIVHLAEFLGIPYETLALEKVSEPAKFLMKALPAQSSCLAVNPQVMEEWLGAGGISADIASFLVSRFSHILVHGLSANTFSSELVNALSQGKLKSVEAIEDEGSVYVVANDSRSICEAFSGLSFGPVNATNDHVLCPDGRDVDVQHLISIGNRPFMASVRTKGAEVFFLASEGIAEVDAEFDGASLAQYFSRFVPHAMALRYAAGEECWRPCNAYASVIIDDPLLREKFGHLKFESLRGLADQSTFHASIAFIPHNFRRSSSRVTRMFNEDAAHLSICFHGNDHTKAEFGSTDRAFLSSLLSNAEERMKLHQELTGLRCDKVMAFPQGSFSIEAMEVLKSHNFCAAVNRVRHPVGQKTTLTIGELAQPAVLRYGDFPLFIRNPIDEIRDHDIAFDLFFGRPILIGEHHDVFKNPLALVEVVARINSLAPGVHWSNLESLVCESILMRKTEENMYYVRPYSSVVRVANDSASVRKYSIRWRGVGDGASVDQVLMDGEPYQSTRVDNSELELLVDIAPGCSKTFSVIHRNGHATAKSLGLAWNVRAFLRRRFSEFRDNYLSKNRRILAASVAFYNKLSRDSGHTD